MKLDKKILDRRIELMKAEGVEFKTGVDVGKDITAEELKRQFDRVILACGAPTPGISMCREERVAIFTSQWNIFLL